MKQGQFWRVLGISVVISLLVACVIITHSLVKDAIAVRTSDRVCLKILNKVSNGHSTCYRTATILSETPTTAMITSPDGQILASNASKTIQLWDLKTGQLKRSLTGHTDWITTLAISPDGQILASGSLDQTIKLWNFNTGTLLATWQSGSVTTLAFSPDGKTLASGNRLLSLKGCNTPNRIQLWNLETGEARFSINSGLVNALAFSPDGQLLAAGTHNTKVWQLPDANLLYTVESNEVNALLFSRDGKWLITGSDGVKGEDGMKFWQAESGKLVRVIDSVATDLAITPSGSMVATTYGGITNLWRMKPLGYLGTLRGSQYSGMLVEFGLNGQAVITGSSDGIRVWVPER